MKIKFIFKTDIYGIVTNDRPFKDEDDMTDDEFGGCIVTFDEVPMYQDYNQIIRKLWGEQLQWDYPNIGKMDVTTEIVE